MEAIKKKNISFINIYQRFGVFFILIVELVVFGVLSGNFFTSANLFTIGKQVACTGIAAVGCTFVMIMAGIDLSVGAMLAVSGILTSWTIVHLGWPMGVSIIAVLVFWFSGGHVQRVLLRQAEHFPPHCNAGNPVYPEGYRISHNQCQGGLRPFRCPSSIWARERYWASSRFRCLLCSSYSYSGTGY